MSAPAATNEARYLASIQAEGAFQDHWQRELARHGIFLGNFASRGANLRGENMLGLELKHDHKFRGSGNLFFETAKRPRGEAGAVLLPSGIFKPESPWLYGIGDFQTLWVFQTRILQLMFEGGRFEKKETDFSTGFVLPLAEADRLAGRKFEAEASGEVGES